MKKNYDTAEDQKLEEIATAVYEYDEEDDYDTAEDQDVNDEDEAEEVEMAPVDLFKRINFFLNRENRKDKYVDFPNPIRKQFTKFLFIAIACAVLSVTFCFVYQRPLTIVVPACLALVCGLMAYRNYLLGACRQYITVKGEVVKSDYQENQVQYFRSAANKATRADFNYRNFTVERLNSDDERLVTVQCKTYKDIPQEGQRVVIYVNMQSSVEENKNEIIIRDYIGIERTVA